MPVIPFWYSLTETERRAIMYWEAYERARVHGWPKRDYYFDMYCWYRDRLETLEHNAALHAQGYQI